MTVAAVDRLVHDSTILAMNLASDRRRSRWLTLAAQDGGAGQVVLRRSPFVIETSHEAGPIQPGFQISDCSFNRTIFNTGPHT
jgi:hypothetical protein